MIFKRREAFRKQYEENREAKIKAAEAEEHRRKQLANSCKPSKVRTYACNESGTRNIKYFNYKYDFDQDKCVEKVKKVTVRCKEAIREEESDDEVEEKPKRRTHLKKNVRSNRKGVHADDYASHTQKKAKDKVSLAHTDNTEEEADQTADTEPAEQAAADPDVPVVEETHVSFAAKRQQQRKIDSSAKQIRKLTQHIGEIEGKVSEVTTKYTEMKKKLAAAEAAAKKAAEEKAAAEAAAKKKEEEEKAAAEKAKEGEAKVQKESSTDPSTSNVQSSSPKDSEAEAEADATVKIENTEDKSEEKDDRISADKIAAVQISSDLTQNDEQKDKIEKFASMLRTLSKAKAEYRATDSKEEKSKIHDKVASYT